MFTKKDKFIMAGFSAMVLIGFTGSAYLLMQGDKDTTDSEPAAEEEIQETAVIIDDDLDSEERDDFEEQIIFPDVVTVFEDEGKEELDQNDAEVYLQEARILMRNNDFQGIVDLISPVIENYNLTSDTNKELAGAYADANLMVVQETMEDPFERSKLIDGITHPLTMVIGAAHLPTDVFLFSPYDGNSAAVGGAGEVVLKSEPIYHSTTVENNGEIVVNPYLLENPVIYLFLEFLEEYDDLLGVEETKLKIQGVDVTAYVAKMDDQSLMLIGFYVDNQEEYGTRFQSVNWHLSHKQRLGDAVRSDWNREGEDQDETTNDDMAQE